MFVTQWARMLAATTPLASSGAGVVADAPPGRSLARAVANPHRPAADRERDVTSRPSEVLGFFGARPAMHVFDLNAATGYFTELLANAVGPRGHVIAHNHPGALTMLGERIAQRY